ncbi:MAG TPA: GNAT family N-acetyltransferase [Polyangiaceae bacterium]|jgi:predicted acetyltransferase|nr:GNAT family N-acetyltransferase [Polyangiaceae bacterium]
MPRTFRPAREDDLERLLDLHASAFPDPRGRPSRARNFQHNPLGGFSDLHVLVEDDALLAHAFLFPLEAWFGGARVRAGGVATVGVAPEARGRGLGSQLVEHLHALSLARGDALTVLYPFRQAYYARLGYAPTSSYRRLRLHPAAIPWRPSMRARPARGTDRDALVACLEAAAERRTGTLARTARAWEARLVDERRTWLVVEGEQGVEGYVVWTLEQGAPHAETVLQLRELAARTPAAERELWALVGAQRDQVAVVHADVAADDPIEPALVDADRARFGDGEVEHTLGEVASGPMVRVLDVARALEARGWRAEGRLVVEVDGTALEVTAKAGRATAAPSRAEPDVRLDARALAAVAFGALPASRAARLGWLTARDDAALARADALLALPPYFSPDPF